MPLRFTSKMTRLLRHTFLSVCAFQKNRTRDLCTPPNANAHFDDTGFLRLHIKHFDFSRSKLVFCTVSALTCRSGADVFRRDHKIADILELKQIINKGMTGKSAINTHTIQLFYFLLCSYFYYGVTNYWCYHYNVHIYFSLKSPISRQKCQTKHLYLVFTAVFKESAVKEIESETCTKV